MSPFATLSPVVRSLRCLAIASLSAAVAIVLAKAGLSLAGDSMTISSPAFATDASIPAAYACTGANNSPPLKWSGVPADAKVLALIVRDPDAPGGTFIHWVAYDIPASNSGLEPNVAAGEAMPDGGKQGVNSFGKIGYRGPCPPPGSAHHYHFQLFALDQPIEPPIPATAEAVETAIKGHVKASAELVGIFQR